MTTPVTLGQQVRHLLSRGLTPELMAGTRRKLGQDAPPQAVVAALGRQMPLPLDLPRPPNDHATPVGGAAIRVCGVDMPARLTATWEQGGPLWVRRQGADAGEGPAVAIVGTRRPTLDGVQAAEGIAWDLAEVGVVVVSGLARGIDQAAHRGALRAGGITTAVIGTGHDVDYPAGSAALRQAIGRSGGIITEYAPDRGIRRKDQFIARNRILAGLADAVVVIEAGVRSGALSTAGWAQAFGRDVLVVPSSPANAAAAGALALLVDGATPVRHGADVLDALGSVGQLSPAIAAPDVPAVQDPVSGDLLRLISAVPATPSALAAATGHPPRDVLVTLSALEEQGVIVHTADGVVRTSGGR